MNIPKFGIGTDIEKVERFRNLDLQIHQTFLNKIFTKKELDYCFSNKKVHYHLAGRYAGKEAVVKALNDIKKVTINYKLIEILINDKGTPFVKLYEKGLNNIIVKISISHCEDYALAFAVAMVNKYE